MRYLTCILFAALAPSLVKLQQPVIDDETGAQQTRQNRPWIRRIRQAAAVNGFENGSEKEGIKIDDQTKNWLQMIMKNITQNNSGRTMTTDATPATIKPTTDDTKNKFDPNLDPNTDFSDNEQCTTDNGEEGVCVLIYQCDSAGVVDNTTLIDLRERNCPNYLQTCCLRSEAKRTKPKSIPLSTECGWSNPGASIFRTKDENNINVKTYADYGEFPWMIAVLRTSANPAIWKLSEYLGGGTLIHTSVVITVAHKVDQFRANQIKCRAGEWDTKTDQELYEHQERNVKKVILHEEYYKTPAFNDIAILILERPFELENAPQIGVACLASSLPKPGTKCFSMGWGQDDASEKKYAVILKKLKLPFVPSEECEVSLKKTRLSPRFTLHASHLCAGGETGVDTCKGDGGSSLVCPIEESAVMTRFSVYGMVAFGVGCFNAVPGVYANIPHLYSWIGKKMDQEGFGSTSYQPR